MTRGFDPKSLLKNLQDDPAGSGVAANVDTGANLRLSLSVRGWTSPIPLLGTDDPKLRKDMLAHSAPYVETAAETRPGQWYLNESARRLIIEETSHEELVRVVEPRGPVDAEDPVRAAFALWLKGNLPPLGDIETPVLRELENVSKWSGEGLNAPLGETVIEAELAARTLDADLVRMTQYPLVGARHRKALEDLRTFATGQQQAPLAVQYIYGGGGSGKTTVLAFLQRELQSRPVPVAVARIDFDEQAIDPERLASLNLALFEQLTRNVKELKASARFLLENLRQMSNLQRASRLSDDSSGRAASTGLKLESQIISESVTSDAEAGLSSILYGKLRPEVLKSPLLIVFDTAELVLSQSDEAALQLVRWLGFLRQEPGAADIRLIIAGRDPPSEAVSADAGPAREDLFTRLAGLGAQFRDPIALSELDPLESAELLKNCGVSDVGVAQAAAQAVPGNPLLLRITANALLSNSTEIKQAVREAHMQRSVDPDSARSYLTRRVVAHVADPEVRPYVLGSMFSPVVTLELLQEVIIPAVEREASRSGELIVAERAVTQMAQRLYNALGASQWLTRRGPVPGTLAFNRDLRALILQLMRASDKSGVFERDLRLSAVIYHQRRRGVLHRSLVMYHLGVLGQAPARPSSRAQARAILRDVLQELPEGLRHWLQAPARERDTLESGVLATSSGKQSDREWREYLEGGGNSDGEGMKLVKGDHAREALDLYYERPTRPQGLAPAFVMRALSDLGQWTTPWVNIEEIISVESVRWLQSPDVSPQSLSDIYWLTRLALQQNHARLSDRHVDVLAKVSSTVRGPGLTQLPALIAVAEAALGRPIMDNRMRQSALKTGMEGRILLGEARDFPPREIELVASQLAVVQRDWLEVAGRDRNFQQNSSWKLLSTIVHSMEGLDGQPIAQVNRVFDELRLRLRIPVMALEFPTRTLLCRGQTSEFHRALREALLVFCSDGMAGPRTRAIVDPVLARMSIIPTEMQPEIYYERLQKNPRAWATALVSFADRCRLLPVLSRELINTGDGRASVIGRSFEAWDKALCRGSSSEWQLASPQETTAGKANRGEMDGK